MVMEPISVDEAESLAQRNGLKPIRDIKTGAISLARSIKPGFQTVSWTEVVRELSERGLALYQSNGSVVIAPQ